MRKIKRKKLKRKYSSKGGLNAGMGFALLLIGAVIGLSALMVGNLVPIDKERDLQEVTLISPVPGSAHDNLQLFTFPGITGTPTPTPEIPEQPQEKGGFNYGEAPGGNSSAPVGQKEEVYPGAAI